jgi:hypothetical protein
MFNHDCQRLSDRLYSKGGGRPFENDAQTTNKMTTLISYDSPGSPPTGAFLSTHPSSGGINFQPYYDSTCWTIHIYPVWKIRFNFLPYSSAKKTGSSFASVQVSNYVITLFGKRLMFFPFCWTFFKLYSCLDFVCTKGCTLLNNEIGLRTRLCAWSIKSSHTRWDLLPENHTQKL